MNSHVLVWDLETIPDLSCVSRVHDLSLDDEAAAREILGEKFPKLPFCERNLVAFVRDRVSSKPHLQYLVPSENLVSPATAIEPVSASAQF